MAIDPEIEEVLGALIDTVEERVQELKTLLGEELGRLDTLANRVESMGGGGEAAQLKALQDRLAQIDRQLQSLQAGQTQINSFLTGVLQKMMLAKKMISQQEMLDVYKSSK
jgi:hypothetical protein